jgi:hypothetical protein
VYGAALSVQFAIRDQTILVDPDNAPAITATPRLNPEGNCLLVVDGRELELWQFRRLALETVFFVNLNKD